MVKNIYLEEVCLSGMKGSESKSAKIKGKNSDGCIFLC
jgi:hypothetical protein